jgi:predicted RNase H-like nuclease (RuvC/YqgF family)
MKYFIAMLNSFFL